ncbi:MAG: hypothetical protein KDK36_05705 [Leptospiraceae bacterium]|nr:hypothetical protein [Leptospiraceae bacterium]
MLIQKHNNFHHPQIIKKVSYIEELKESKGSIEIIYGDRFSINLDCKDKNPNKKLSSKICYNSFGKEIFRISQEKQKICNAHFIPKNDKEGCLKSYLEIFSEDTENLGLLESYSKTEERLERLYNLASFQFGLEPIKYLFYTRDRILLLQKNENTWVAHHLSFDNWKHIFSFHESIQEKGAMEILNEIIFVKDGEK